MRQLFLTLSFLSLLLTASGQDKFTLSGYVKDASTGEELIGVTVWVDEIKNGTTTNFYGFYSVTLPAGDYTLNYSYVGYKSIQKTVTLSANTEFNIDLPSEALEIDGVVITDKPIDANVTDIKMSRNELNVEQVKKLPALFGEPDIIKTVQMLPGVITAGEGTSSFFVRGGSADQNLILIDEAPVYDPSHLFGLFSVFNADVIKDSEIYRGGIPARYGGRLSSILDVRTKDGNNKKFGGSAAIGTLASKIMLEGPIKKNESSYIVSARRSYADLFLKMSGNKNTVYFYDVNAKVNWKFNNNNRLYAAFYKGRDDFSLDGTFGFDWGNTTGTLRWNHLFSDKLFSNTSLIASNFDYITKFDDAAQGFIWNANMKEYSFKQDFNYYMNPMNELQFGYHLTYRKIAPGKIAPSQEGTIFKDTELAKLYSLEHSLYLSNQQTVTDKLSFEYGLRVSIFQNVGKQDVFVYEDPYDNINIKRTDTLSYGKLENIKTFVNWEPRFSARLMVSPKSSIKASYNRMVQNVHLISSGTVPLPFNTWQPSGPYLKPQIADQYAMGYFRNFKDNTYEVSVEGYYKDMQDVTDFADNAEIFFNDDLSTEFRQGKSWSYGAEFMAQKVKGDVTGFVSYTYSKTQREIPGVNRGEAFNANYDRRHVFNAVGTYEMNDKWTFGASFTYTSGRPTTIPSGRYEFGSNYNIDLITERNAYVLPTFHRLDLSATLNPRVKKDRNWRGQWVFSIYNAYNRSNPFTVYTRTVQNDKGEVIDPNKKEARMVYLFPILPSITYKIKF